MKVTDKNSLIEAQYSILLKVEQLNASAKNEHVCPEREMIKESAFAALILMKAEKIKQREKNIIFRDMTICKNGLTKKYPFLKELIEDLPVFEEKSVLSLQNDKNNSQISIVETTDNKIAPEEPGCKEEVVSVDLSEKSMTDTEENGLIFGKYQKEISSMEHCETREAKYFDTMWFNRFHITCNIKDGFMPENFIIVVFPTKLSADRRPLPQAVALLHNNSKKIVFSNGEQGTSVEINYEDYMFAITSRFVDGKLNTKISLASREYEITDKEEENFSGKIIPEHFGKSLKFGKEEIYIYPLDISNDEQSGCVPFMYEFVANDGVIYGTSEEDDFAVIATKEGGAKRISCYWAGQDVTRKLNFTVD